jgi:rhodanese-related sulfurtransferase
MQSIQTSQLEEFLRNPLVSELLIVDVRPEGTTPHDLAHVHLPLERIQQGQHALPHRPLLLLCEWGAKSELAGLYLEAEGYQVWNLKGGIRQLTALGHKKSH